MLNRSLHCPQDKWRDIKEEGKEEQGDFSIVMFFVFIFSFAFVHLFAYFNLFPYGREHGRDEGRIWGLGGEQNWGWGAWCETHKVSIKKSFFKKKKMLFSPSLRSFALRYSITLPYCLELTEMLLTHENGYGNYSWEELPQGHLWLKRT